MILAVVGCEKRTAAVEEYLQSPKYIQEALELIEILDNPWEEDVPAVEVHSQGALMGYLSCDSRDAFYEEVCEAYGDDFDFDQVRTTVIGIEQIQETAGGKVRWFTVEVKHELN